MLNSSSVPTHIRSKTMLTQISHQSNQNIDFNTAKDAITHITSKHIANEILDCEFALSVLSRSSQQNQVVSILKTFYEKRFQYLGNL